MHMTSTSVGFVIFFIDVLIKICVIWKVLSYEPPFVICIPSLLYFQMFSKLPGHLKCITNVWQREEVINICLKWKLNTWNGGTQLLDPNFSFKTFNFSFYKTRVKMQSVEQQMMHAGSSLF